MNEGNPPPEYLVVPRPMLALLNTADRAASQRAFPAMLTMTKLDIAALQRAYDGG